MQEENTLSTTRLEAFSDGVMAIIITIMVLELKAPHEASWEAIREVGPTFLAYVLSFITVGIYWNNHHHIIKAAKQTTAAIMWANLHLLFWVSLIPFTTAWLGDTHGEALPTAIYGFALLMSGLGFQILQKAIIADTGKDSLLAQALGKDFKGKLSLTCYSLGIFAAFWHPLISFALYLIVVFSWLLPDPRVEKRIIENEA